MRASSGRPKCYRKACRGETPSPRKGGWAARAAKSVGRAKGRVRVASWKKAKADIGDRRPG
eukprot:12334319-Alexandrium_andersonii.AAC.1